MKAVLVPRIYSHPINRDNGSNYLPGSLILVCEENEEMEKICGGRDFDPTCASASPKLRGI